MNKVTLAGYNQHEDRFGFQNAWGREHAGPSTVTPSVGLVLTGGRALLGVACDPRASPLLLEERGDTTGQPSHCWNACGSAVLDADSLGKIKTEKF